MIEVLTSGLSSSIQDLGRSGGKLFGIPGAGAMDQLALKQGNQFLSNEPNAASIEWMMQGPVLRFQQPTFICLTGGVQTPLLNGMAVDQNKVLEIKAGDQLKLGRLKEGVFGYVTIHGGIQTEVVYQSRSQFSAITTKKNIQKGDTLPYHSIQKRKVPQNNRRISTSFSTSNLEVQPGPEFHLLSMPQKEMLLHGEHQISRVISRMGYRFIAEKNLATPEIITAPVLPGTIQLTPAGQLIALMRDAQTTGGYARVLQLTEMAINQLAQKRIGTAIRFNIQA